MRQEHGRVAERFQALPPLAAESDWEDVLLRAGLHPSARPGRGRIRRPLILGLLVVAGLAGGAVLGTRLHRAAASPLGPTRVQRQVRNGTVAWLFAHKPRGQSLAEAHIALLSTVGAHWQPVRFARAITPDPHSQVKVALSLIGKRGRNICMTVYLGHSEGGGGGCAFGLPLKPFKYDVTSYVNPSCAGCSEVVVAGLASDDVARMELFLPGRHQTVPLRDNVFLVTLGPSVSAWSLVAYDPNGLVIGRSNPPPSIQTPAPAKAPANAPSGLTITQVSGEPSSHGPLNAARENVVVVSPGLHFAVGVRNGNLRRKLIITLTISGGSLGSPTIRHQTITLRPHAGTTVRLGNLGGKVAFAQLEQLKIQVADTARGETWARTYPIIFALG